MEIENVKKETHQKLQIISGEEFPLEKEFDEQILEIRKHFLVAIEGELRPDYDRVDEYTSWGISQEYIREKVQTKFYETYTKTNSWLEKLFLGENRPALFACFGMPEWKEQIMKRISTRYINLKYQWQLIENVGKYLKSEDITKVKKNYINILDKYNQILTGKKRLDNSEFTVLIYLITPDRIIPMYINNEKIISSTERIIKKDLKKVELVNETYIQFHYHGLHKPDVLHLDSYEIAIDLRKEITKLRENNFNKPYPKH